jgi:hypothetical protein
MPRKSAIWALLALTLVVTATGALLPRTPQPLSYHNFADRRAWLGVANFGDVVSNLPFVLVGIWGLAFLWRLRGVEFSAHFVDRRERWAYLIVFLGLLLTAFGSAYYHLAPDNARLVWDRLPMTIVFMALVAAMISERISVRAGLWLLPLLLAIGILSVLQWHWSELRGAGDLRLYAAVQVYCALVLLLVLLFPTPYTRGKDLGMVVVFYVLAKLLETFDQQIFKILHIVSGHTLKHLAAAVAGYWILRMLMRRNVAPLA